MGRQFFAHENAFGKGEALDIVLTMQRRHFLATTAGALLAPRATQAADGTATVLLGEPIGTIVEG